MLDLCGQHNLTADVEVIPIQKVNEAYERLLKSDVKYRFAIDMALLQAEIKDIWPEREPMRRLLSLSIVGLFIGMTAVSLSSEDRAAGDIRDHFVGAWR